MPRLRLQLLAAGIFMLAWMQLSRTAPRQESGVLPIDPPTPYVHYIGKAPPLGRILVVHGLDVSKETTGFISAALADGGFEVYAIDLPGHGDSLAPFQTALAQTAISNSKAFLGDDTIVLGHSLGAGLLLDLAATEHFSTMVLLAAPPLPIAQIHADRVLLATGELDVPRIRSFVPVAADIGESKTETWLLSWGAHSSPIFNPFYIKRIVGWLGGDSAQTRTETRLVCIAVMFLSAVVFGAAWTRSHYIEAIDTPATGIIASYIAAYTAALFMLKVFHPMKWLRLFATDYLIGFLLVAGIVIVIAALYQSRSSLMDLRPYRLLHAILAAAFVILVPALLVASWVLHMSLSAGRWWRFPWIALAGLPLFIADELWIRRIHPRWKAQAIGILTRGLLFAFILTGVLTFNRESAFLLLIIPLITIFWIALWFAAGVVHRQTQSPIAAAVFSALVQGWAFAALFVMT